VFFNRLYSEYHGFANSGIELFAQFAAARNFYSAAAVLGSVGSKSPWKKSESYPMPSLLIFLPHHVIMRAVFSGSA
jgi:hypothetical protein